MSRFEPESLQRALMRFFDMAAPDANIYIEIPAPDIRFAAVLLLGAGALLCWRRLGPHRAATMAMLLVLLVSASIWLATTGNGRYFMPLLIAVGPVAIGLVCLLPVTRGFKAALAMLLVAGQGFVISEQPPWNTWSYLHWREGSYFDIRLGPEELQAPPTTYGTLSMISYSLIAPQFPAESRWINLVAGSATPRDEARIDAFLRDSAARGPMRVLAPSLPWGSLPDGRPTPRVLEAFNELLAKRNLKISGDCRLIVSPGLVRMAEREKSADTKAPHPLGFWSCPMVYEVRPAERQRVEQPPELVVRSFDQLARLCPQFFPASEASILRLPDAWSRHYAASETRVYVTDTGEVWMKYWRSINPVRIAAVAELVAGRATFDCATVRGSDGAWRSGAK
jgi:hypothetical protein